MSVCRYVVDGNMVVVCCTVQSCSLPAYFLLRCFLQHGLHCQHTCLEFIVARPVASGHGRQFCAFVEAEASGHEYKCN